MFVLVCDVVEFWLVLFDCIKLIVSAFYIDNIPISRLINKLNTFI